MLNDRLMDVDFGQKYFFGLYVFFLVYIRNGILFLKTPSVIRKGLHCQLHAIFGLVPNRALLFCVFILSEPDLGLFIAIDLVCFRSVHSLLGHYPG